MGNNNETANIKIVIEGDDALKVVDALKDRLSGLKQKLDGLDPDGKAFKATKKEIKETESALKDAEKQIIKLKTNWDEFGNNLSNKTLRELDNAYRQLGRTAAKMHPDSAEFEKTAQLMQRVKERSDELKTSLRGVDTQWQSFVTNSKQIAAGFVGGNLINNAFMKVEQITEKVITKNAELADSYADIEKATGLTHAQVIKLNRELDFIDTRTKAQDLREIAVGLGQIGEEANKANIGAIDKIVVALGDEFGGGAKEITTVLSVLRNNLSDIKSGNYSEDVLHIGNAINELGAKGLATGPVVTDISNRISGVARTFNVTSGQILGTAATFQELGIEVERGSTAYVKLIQKIAAEPEKFFNVVNGQFKNSKDFIKLVQTDINAAFLAVAKGAREAGSDNIAFGQTLKELDTDGVGVSELLSKAGANAELFKEKINLATTALTQTSSISSEFTKKSDNLAGSIERISKWWNGLFIVSDDSGITGAINWFSKIVDSVSDAEQALRDYKKIQEETAATDAKLTDLLKQYADLSANTKRSAEENEKLGTVITAIGEIVPTAVTGFDQYGKALGISTDKVRDFMKLQQQMKEITNEEAIKKTTAGLFDVNAELQRINLTLAQRDKNGDIVKIDRFGESIKLSSAEITKMTQRISELEGKKQGLQGILNDLKGISNVKTDDTDKEAEKKKAEEAKAAAVAAAKAKGEALTEEEKKQLKALDEQIHELQIEAGVRKLDEDAKELFHVDAKYAKLKDKAKGHAKEMLELEKLHAGERAAALEKVNDKVAKEALKEAEQIAKQRGEEEGKTTKKRKADREAAHKAEVAAEIIEQQQRRIKGTITEVQYVKAIEDIQIKGLEKKREQFIKGSEEYNQATQEINAITIQRNEKMAAQDAAISAARYELANTFVSGFKDLLGKDAESRKEYGTIIKSLALAEIAINLSRELSALATASGFNILNLVTFGAAGATQYSIQSAIAIGRAAFAAATVATTQFAQGGYTDMPIAMSNDPQGWVEQPTYFQKLKNNYIAGEAGTEWIAPHWMVTHPKMISHFAQLENIRQSKTFAAGGFSNVTTAPTFTGSVNTTSRAGASATGNTDQQNQQNSAQQDQQMKINAMLIQVLGGIDANNQKLSAQLDSPIKADISYGTLTNAQDTVAVIKSAASLG